MASNIPLVTLEVFQGPKLVKRAEFREQSITVGRGGNAMFSVSEGSLADLACVLNLEEDGSITLLDLVGDAVTVNGKATTSATVRNGDRFNAGGLEFHVVVHADGADFDGEKTNVTGQNAPDGDDATDEKPLPPKKATPAPVARTESKKATPAPVSRASAAPPSSAPDHAAAAPHSPDDVPADAVAEGDHGADDHGDDDDHEHEDAADVVEFVMRTNQGRDVKRPMVLEVNQMWGNALVETKQFPHLTRNINIGADLGYRWVFLGVDMGWVPAPLGMILPFTMPLWNDMLREVRNDFHVPRALLPGEEDFNLFVVGDDGNPVAHIPKGWEGFVDVEDKRYTFEELIDQSKAVKAADGSIEVKLDPSMRLMTESGGHIFFAQLAWQDLRLTPRMTDDIDYAFMGLITFFGMIFLIAGMGLYFNFEPHSTKGNQLEDRFVDLMLEKPPEEPKKEKKKTDPDAGEGAKAKKEEGKTGKKESKIDKTKGNKREVKQQEIDRKVAENAGVLGAMQDNAMDQVLGASGLSSELRGGIGGLIGSKGTQFGSGGLGSRGGGLGGGGTAEGLGGLGTKGMGAGSSGYGQGGGDFGPKSEGGIAGVGGDPVILGALDRSLIDEVVKRYMSQIRYCYQRELTKNPTLGGKITIKFVIAKDGSVSSAEPKTTTMGNPAVESCISGRFLRMQFPQPKGGGIVIVSYPFIFSPP